MEKDVLSTLEVTVTKMSVEYNRKVGDGNFGSIGASMTFEASLGAGADPDTAANALYEFCKEAVARNLKPEAVAARVHPATAVTPPAPIPTTWQPIQPAPAPVAPPPAPSIVSEEVDSYGQPSTPGGKPNIDIVTLDAPLCAHLVQDGQHRFKVFGGKWAKFGVPVYEEVLKQYKIEGWEAWAVCATTKGVPETGNRFQLPGGFQRAEVEVNAEGKPLRVHAFK